jgi:hypothetical protein
MKVVLDAGALIGIERADRRVTGLIALARRSEGELVTSAPVVGQVWRDGARQARLARALELVDVRDVSLSDAKAAGVLLKESQSTDIVDALVALLATPGDQVLTSDREDIEVLVAHRPGPVTVVAT